MREGASALLTNIFQSIFNNSNKSNQIQHKIQAFSQDKTLFVLSTIQALNLLFFLDVLMMTKTFVLFNDIVAAAELFICKFH